MLTRPSPAASLNPAARAWGTTDGGHRGSPGSQAAYAEWERDTHWYPLSRWYLRPLAKRVARGLARYRIHPNLVSLGGLLLAAVGGACLMSARGLTAESGRILAQLAPAALVLGYWMLDQVDGHLARLKGLSSPYGGWLDANLDELIDVGLHVTAACVLVGQNRNSIPLVLVLGFVVGKYLFMYGLQLGPEQRMERGRGSGQNWGGRGNESGEAVARRPGNEWVRRLYHLPADADVRVHVFVGATVLGALWWELLFVAAYYNSRWMARHVLLLVRYRRDEGLRVESRGSGAKGGQVSSAPRGLPACDAALLGKPAVAPAQESRVESRESRAERAEATLEAEARLGRPSLAAVLITLNEEENLQELLPALAWADEIVVVDGGSRDGTVEVARRYGERVWVHPFDEYAQQRNRALDKATAEWVLSIDADERPTPAFWEEVQWRLREPGACVAFRVPIRSTIFGRPFRYSGTQDDRPVRLFRRDRARWRGEVHEVLEVDGEVGELEVGLQHHALPDLHTLLAKLNHYTTLEARSRAAAGQRCRVWDLCWPPLREVFRRLIWKRGVLDGPAGWLFCALSGFSTFVMRLKQWEMASGRVGESASRQISESASRRVGETECRHPRWMRDVVGRRP